MTKCEKHFLHYLFGKGLVVQTIAGHRSMLASALKFHMKLDLTHSKELTQLIENFRHEWPPASSPKVGSRFNLLTLMDKPFKSVRDEKQVSLTYLTWKVTFLLLLASDMRRRELHTIPFKGISYPKDFFNIPLSPFWLRQGFKLVMPYSLAE